MSGLNFILTPSLLWLIAAIILCFMELIFPTAFVEFMMGVSAGLVALISLILPQFSLQVILWLILSVILIVISRRFFTPKKKLSYVDEDQEGQTLTSIPAGESGRVLYEGNSWRAKCADENLTINPEELVYIVGKQGTTLIVLPKKYGD
jgi:membrane protein implicated in regulation of membrane protease activity